MITNPFGCEDLSLDQLRETLVVVSETHFGWWILSNVPESVQLSNLFLLHGVDIEVLIGNYDLFIKIIDYLLFVFCHFFHHVIARDENSVEIFLVRESWFLALDFAVEVGLAVCSWNELEAFHLHFGLHSLHMMRDLKKFNHRLSWSLGMLIPVLSFHHIVKTSFCFPSGFIILFLLYDNFIFIDDWEGETQMLGRISVEF